MFFTVKQYSHIRARTCISCHVQSAYLPMPPSTPQGSVSAELPVTLGCVCVCAAVVWWGVMGHQTDLVSPLSSPGLSVALW